MRRHCVSFVNDSGDKVKCYVARACDICGKEFRRFEERVTVASYLAIPHFDEGELFIAPELGMESYYTFCISCKREYFEKCRNVYSDLVSTRRKAR